MQSDQGMMHVRYSPDDGSLAATFTFKAYKRTAVLYPDGRSAQRVSGPGFEWRFDSRGRLAGEQSIPRTA